MVLLKALVLLLVQLAACLCLDGELTEGILYQSTEWRNRSQHLIFTKPKSVPERFLKALLLAIKNSPVIHFQVLCPESSGSKPTAETGEVCHALTDHHVATRVGGVLKGFATPTEGYDMESAFVAAVLEHLLGSSITQLISYTDLVQFTTDHKQYLLLLEPDTSSEEYTSLLSALLTWPLPLGVAMTANSLPLSRRPYYSRNPPPLQLWCVVGSESGQLWLPFHDTGQLSEDALSSGRPPAQLVKDFVERLQFPIIVHYDNDRDLKLLFSDSGLHLVVVFPGLSGASDIEPLPLVMDVAPKSFMNYAFVLADRSRDSEYGARLFVTDKEPMPHIVILPYGQETNIIGIDVDGPNFANEVERISGLLYSIAMDNPKTPGDAQVFADLGPSITDASVVRALVTEKKHHILGYFCHQDTDDCLNDGYSIVRDVLGVVRRTDLGRSFAAHVIQCRSAEDAQQFKVESLPGCAIFNKTTGRWSAAAKEDISSNIDVLRFLSRLTGLSELEEMGVTLFENPPPMPSAPPPPPPPMQEEDQLNLVARSLKHPTLPPQIKLTTNNFDQHISKFLKTAVVFCVKWSVRCKVFLHHVAAAHRLLDEALDVSLATVGCDDYTELCTQHHITDYPTVLVFSRSALHSPTQLTGVLDATHLLTALGQSGGEKGDTPLVELTPSSLPHLLREGGLERTVVLWSASDTTSVMAKVFLEEVSRNVQSDLIFAWINSTRHFQLLSRILPNAVTSPSLIAVNFKQHTMYHFPLNDGLSTDDGKSELSSFLTSLREGTLEPTGHLTEKMWRPVQPPIQFPSTDSEFEEDMFDNGQFHEDSHFHDEDFQYHDHDRLHHHDPTEGGHATNIPHPPIPPNIGHHRHSEL